MARQGAGWLSQGALCRAHEKRAVSRRGRGARGAHGRRVHHVRGNPSGRMPSAPHRRLAGARRAPRGSLAGARRIARARSRSTGGAMAGRLKDKVAIVTGAGSRGPGLGNGKATAILFAREGAKVLCVDAEVGRAQETATQIKSEKGTAEALAADVTRASDCKSMVEEASRRWGGIDILHNNVGVESRLD